MKFDFFPSRVFYRRKWSKPKISPLLSDSPVDPDDRGNRPIRAKKRKNIFRALMTDPFQPMVGKKSKRKLEKPRKFGNDGLITGKVGIILTSIFVIIIL